MLLLIGIISGFIIGLFFYLCQLITNKPVYTLLMNIDYFPIIGKWQHPPLFEFSYHIIVSIVLVYTLIFFLRLWDLERKLWAYVSISGLIGLLIYPTTLLSNRTPELYDGYSIIIWLIGHLIYGSSIGLLQQYWNKT
ncbi:MULTISPECIES: hypothetical protein [Oceanobacillus]|uniref:DUF1440 domain-containing protein n=1 Tax=Oceanobacillus kimchii TaxID=746691 RepID=A0ABQ5TR72_9BACI|nr:MULTISPECIES: hypothetical protein [Oceanobacillus]MBT2599527.1 hypothetical protein [Oceanobacillus sp. ISL-74]GLO67750.1 hypothetical protein MACH08_35340 [Oceanobacillus kimchii]